MSELFGPGDINRFSRPLDVMWSFRGQAEEPPGSNRGPLPDRALRHVGVKLFDGKPGKPWCCGLVCLCLSLGGVADEDLYRTPSCWGLLQRHRRFVVPYEQRQQGDVFVHLENPTGDEWSPGHAGFWLRDHDDGRRAWEISGNTNELGSREGDRLGEKPRFHSYYTALLRFPIRDANVLT